MTETKGDIKKANLTFTAKFLWLLVRHCLSPQSTIDVGLIRDGANELAPRRGPRPELPPLADDLGDMVAKPTQLHRRRPLTLPRLSLSRVVALPRAPLAHPLYQLWSRLLGSRCANGYTSTSYPAVDAEVYYRGRRPLRAENGPAHRAEDR